jgi:ParB family chromosome partitioning protein
MSASRSKTTKAVAGHTAGRTAAAAAARSGAPSAASVEEAVTLPPTAPPAASPTAPAPRAARHGAASRTRRKFEEPADAYDPFAGGSNVGDYLGRLDPSGEAARPDTHVPLADVRPFPGQPRRHFDPAGIEELAASIAREGLINPLTVRPAPAGGYELLAGERRYRALSYLAEQHGTPTMTVPVVVKAVGDLQARAITARENLDREDLSKWETALAYRNVAEVLREERGEDPGYEALADYIGRAVGVVHEYLTIAGRVDEAALTRAGFADAEGRPDYGRIARLSKSVLLKAAKAASDETRVAVLAREAERIGGAGADAPLPGAARRKAGALDSQRTLADRYYEEGGFRINLPGALKKLSPQDAAKYLDAMLPAISGLVDRAMVEEPGHVFARPAGRGYVVYVPTVEGEHPDAVVRAAAAWLAAHVGEGPDTRPEPGRRRPADRPD